MRSRLLSTLTSQGVPHAAAAREARAISQSQGGSSTGSIPHFVGLDFAYATHVVLYLMAGMALAALVALRGLRRGVQEEIVPPDPEEVPQAAA
jgi:hypothetical protein